MLQPPRVIETVNRFSGRLRCSCPADHDVKGPRLVLISRNLKTKHFVSSEKLAQRLNCVAQHSREGAVPRKKMGDGFIRKNVVGPQCLDVPTHAVLCSLQENG